jgi:hypothetical protein
LLKDGDYAGAVQKLRDAFDDHNTRKTGGGKGGDTARVILSIHNEMIRITYATIRKNYIAGLTSGDAKTIGTKEEYNALMEKARNIKKTNKNNQNDDN